MEEVGVSAKGRICRRKKGREGETHKKEYLTKIFDRGKGGNDECYSKQ